MECFIVYSNEIEGRLDAFYYNPEFIDIDKKIKPLKCKKIQDISLDLKNGSTPTGGVFEKEGIPYFRSQDFNLFDFKFRQFITPEFHKQLIRSTIKSGDVLIAVVGATLGVVGYVPDEIKEGNINQNVARIRVIDKNINPKYLAIFLASDLGQKLIFRNATITTQAYLNNQQLGAIEIPIPSLKTQDYIVKIMESTYSEKKNKEQEAKKLFNSINDYVLDELGIKLSKLEYKMCFVVNSKKVKNKRADSYYYQPKFKKVEEALEKGKYEIKELKEFITKIHYGVSIKNVYVAEGIPLLRILNLKTNKINLTNVVKLSEFKRKEIGNGFVYEGDLLISRSGSVGIVAVVPKEADGFAFGSFMIKFCVNEQIDKEYVSIWLNSQISQLFTEREKIGAIQGNITIPTIEDFKIPVPPIEMQNKIAEEVKKRMQKAEQLNQEAKNVVEEAKKKVEELIIKR